MHAQFPYLQEIILILAAAGLVMPVVRRFQISPVLGFLCVGVAVGPFGLGRLDQEVPLLGYLVITELEGVRALGELGVIFLLFSIGLEMSVTQIWGMRRIVFGIGSAQILTSAAVIAGIFAVYGISPQISIFFGLCLALSSTAIVMQLLSEKLRLGSKVGRDALGVLLMQDLAVVPILIYVNFLGEPTGGSIAVAVLRSLGEALLVISAIMLIGRIVVRPILRLSGGNGSREMFMASVLLLILGIASLTAIAGLSMALGAFLAGLLFSGTEYRHQINSDIEPFKGLLLAVFFISIGMRLDVAVVWYHVGVIALAAIGLILLKSVILFGVLVAARRSVGVAAETALLLGQGGEFALIAVTSALALGVVDGALAQLAILIVVVTMFLTPALEIMGRKFSSFLRRGPRDASQLDEDAASGRIVIAGFGRVGRTLGKILEDQRIAYIAIDADTDIAAREDREGCRIYFGDASNPELLRQIGIRHAAAFVTTMDRPGAAEAVISAIHKQWPHIPIYARARDPEQSRALTRLGAVAAVPETTEASLQLSEAVLSSTGLPDEVARRIIDQERQALS